MHQSIYGTFARSTSNRRCITIRLRAITIFSAAESILHTWLVTIQSTATCTEDRTFASSLRQWSPYSNPRIGSSRRHSQTVAPKSNVPPNSTVALPVMTSRDPTNTKISGEGHFALLHRLDSLYWNKTFRRGCWNHRSTVLWYCSLVLWLQHCQSYSHWLQTILIVSNAFHRFQITSDITFTIPTVFRSRRASKTGTVAVLSDLSAENELSAAHVPTSCRTVELRLNKVTEQI